MTGRYFSDRVAKSSLLYRWAVIAPLLNVLKVNAGRNFCFRKWARQPSREHSERGYANRGDRSAVMTDDRRSLFTLCKSVAIIQRSLD
jgi:hypothetical protein